MGLSWSIKQMVYTPEYTILLRNQKPLNFGWFALNYQNSWLLRMGFRIDITTVCNTGVLEVSPVGVPQNAVYL